ncbi:hypothetical protein [Acinetobacter sp. 251-1]|uniref:hypothetical protein n=1 Tax=Acinetobacter sp. 251-1 TaxID=2746720 RepID=UPI002575A627|nr:hypothetical protein [Acinetobacter sp. 251-1]MDM1762099.1 hypothetical protein [Acinetobacter sp. 251-1]
MMKNAWLIGVAGVVLGGAGAFGYVSYQNKNVGTTVGVIKEASQPKTTEQSNESKKSSFLSQELVDARLNELSFKEIMRLFYKDNMRNVYVNEDELETENFIGLGATNESGEDTVALMHPIINYRNVEGDARFLVIIEKVQVMDNGSVVSCHACVGSADLYTFKKLKNGQYQVVSITHKDQEFGGSYGRVHLDREEILNNMQPIGKNLIGSFYQSGYSSTGETSISWNVIHLPEDDFIGAYGVAEKAGDNGGNHEEGSPLHYSFDSQIQVIDNNEKYYPIQVSYFGEKYNTDYTEIIPADQKVVLKFDSIKKEYE